MEITIRKLEKKIWLFRRRKVRIQDRYGKSLTYRNCVAHAFVQTASIDLPCDI